MEEYHEQLYTRELENQNEMDKSLETQNLPRRYHEENRQSE